MYKIDRIELAEKSRLVLCGKNRKPAGGGLPWGENERIFGLESNYYRSTTLNAYPQSLTASFCCGKSKPNRL